MEGSQPQASHVQRQKPSAPGGVGSAIPEYSSALNYLYINQNLVHSLDSHRLRKGIERQFAPLPADPEGSMQVEGRPRGGHSTNVSERSLRAVRVLCASSILQGI